MRDNAQCNSKMHPVFQRRPKGRKEELINFCCYCLDEQLEGDLTLTHREVDVKQELYERRWRS